MLVGLNLRALWGEETWIVPLGGGSVPNTPENILEHVLSEQHVIWLKPGRVWPMGLPTHRQWQDGL